MARFNRINLDGCSITETRTAAVDVLPGTALAITADRFVVSDGAGAVYVANTGHLMGLSADDAIPAGNSIEGEYLETGRGIAVLVDAGTEVTMDTPLTVGADGVFAIAQPGTPADGEDPAVPADRVLAYGKEDYTVGDEPELVWVRGA